MTNPSKTHSAGNPDKPEDIFSALGTVAQQLSTIEKFIARRFDEISMEINATSQQMDIKDADMTTRFGEILRVLHAISVSQGGLSPANAGVELDTVVDITQQAANRILDAAERISTRLGSENDWNSEDKRQKVREETNRDIEEIFTACSFQDLTGQRIRKTLENLRMVEERLGSALKSIGIDSFPEPNEPAELPKASSQDEIDSLF